LQIKSLSSVLNAKGKTVANYTQTQLKVGIRTFYAMQKEVRSRQNSQAVKNGAALKSLGEKS